MGCKLLDNAASPVIWLENDRRTAHTLAFDVSSWSLYLDA
jgi:hypothetical protein